MNNAEINTFLSENFIYCNTNHTEMLGVLTFMSFPFEASEHEINSSENEFLSIKAGSNTLIFYKEMKEGKAELNS